MKRKPTAEERKRLARNKASREWKKKNKAKVRAWNKAWYAAKKK